MLRVIVGDNVDADKNFTWLVMKRLPDSRSVADWEEFLQTLYTFARELPHRCKWEENFKAVLFRLMSFFAETSVSRHKVLILRILREMLKSEPNLLKDYAEMTTMKVLKGFADPDSVVCIHLLNTQ